jgi:DNA invertase Pin-like site-specific DNA recombinase
VRVFKDEGRSGYSGEFRPGFEEMLTFLSKGDVQVLIARHHDRLTRNAEDFDRLMKICGKSKIKISTYTAASSICPQRVEGSTASWRPAGRGTNQRSGASG